jgi:hypothetical protein
MIQQLLQRSFRSRQAGLLALLAVLLLAGTPVLEAVHDHDAGTSYTDCLYCKQATDLPIVTSPGEPSIAVAHAPADLPFDTPAPRGPCANYSPRGPPLLS